MNLRLTRAWGAAVTPPRPQLGAYLEASTRLAHRHGVMAAAPTMPSMRIVVMTRCGMMLLSLTSSTEWRRGPPPLIQGTTHGVHGVRHDRGTIHLRGTTMTGTR
jgi:hypothetical protein